MHIRNLYNPDCVPECVWKSGVFVTAFPSFSSKLPTSYQLILKSDIEEWTLPEYFTMDFGLQRLRPTSQTFTNINLIFQT